MRPVGYAGYIGGEGCIGVGVRDGVVFFMIGLHIVIFGDFDGLKGLSCIG